MAAHLIEQSYFAPAASLTGAVLEDALRRLAEANGLKATGNLESLNDLCAEREIYKRHQQKQIKAWIELRNSADHARWEDFTAADVRLMHQGVQAFVGQHLEGGRR